MTAYPSNSHRQNPEQRPEVDPVTINPVRERKRPLGRRILESFKGDSAQSVSEYVIFDVVIPMFKNVLFDAFTQGFERALLGDNGRRRTGMGRSDIGRGRPYPYEQISRGGVPAHRPPQSRPQGAPRDTGGQFNEFVVNTRIEGEKVLDVMGDLLDRYGVVRVSEYMSALGVTGNFTDEKWGWYNLRSAGIRRVSDGYVIDLPAPVPVD